MKKVIFVYLLSLSMCLSQATQTQEAQVPPAVSLSSATTNTKVSVAPEHPQTAPVETKAADSTTPVVPPATQTQNATTTTNTPQTVPTQNDTPNKKDETKPAKTNATDAKADKDAPKPTDDKKVLPPQTKKETKPVIPADKPNNGTADNKHGKKNETTTLKPEVSPTTAPVPVEAKSRAFDGPSFIGGIILTLGLLAIGFMGFKYYKNQTERNYHTL